MTIIPWHIHYSRVGWEPASFLPFLLFSTYFFIHGINNNKKYLIALAFGLFTLTIYTYHTAPLYSFLFLFSLFILNYKYFLREKKLFVICIIISLILVSPYLWTALNEEMMYARGKRISTFKYGVNLEAFSTFTQNYLSHFNPKFLFISGDPFLRNGAGVGTLYWIMLPLMLIGIRELVVSDIQRRYKIFIAVWILIFPLAGSLTNHHVPQATRTLPGAPILCLLSVIGLRAIYKFIELKTRKALFSNIFTVIIIVLSLLSLGYSAREYYFEYPKKSYSFWDYGHKDIFSIMKGFQDNHQRACLENLNYANEIQIVDYYLKNTHLEIIKDLDDPKCLESGTIVVQWTGNKIISRNIQSKGLVKGPDGNSVYRIYVIK